MNTSFSRQIMALFILGLLSLISACGGGGGGGDGSTGNGSSSITLSGTAVMGPINGATVNAYSITAAGAQGSLLATTTTSTLGVFSLNMGVYSGAVLLNVTGGTYIDEATGATKSNSGIRAAIPNVTASMTVVVTAVTEIAIQRAGTLTAANIIASNQALSNLVGGVNILTTIPTNPTDPLSANSSPSAKEYGLMLATISQMATLPAYSSGGTASVIASVSADLADGMLNSTGSDMSTALSSFVSSTFNQAGITMEQSSLDAYISYATSNFLPTGQSIGYFASEYIVMNNGDLRTMKFTSGATGTLQRIYSAPVNTLGYSDITKEDIYMGGSVNSSNYWRSTNQGIYIVDETSGANVKVLSKNFNINDQYLTPLGGTESITVTVLGFEDVLGFKDCLKIRLAWTLNSGTGYYDFWFSKGFGLVEKSGYDSITEHIYDANIGGVQYYRADDYFISYSGDWRNFNGLNPVSIPSYSFRKEYFYPASFGGYTDLYRINQYQDGAFFQTMYELYADDGAYMIGGVTNLTPLTKMIGRVFRIGDIYSTQFNDTSGGGRLTVRVEAIESATVPMGTFPNTLKLKWTITGPNYGTKSQWYWYAKNIGDIKYMGDDGWQEVLVSARINNVVY